jgi:hypothetical protein
MATTRAVLGDQEERRDRDESKNANATPSSSDLS